MLIGKPLKTKLRQRVCLGFTYFLEMGLVENQDFGMINDACLTEITPEWVDENGEGRCTVGNVGKLLTAVFC